MTKKTSLVERVAKVLRRKICTPMSEDKFEIHEYCFIVMARAAIAEVRKG